MQRIFINSFGEISHPILQLEGPEGGYDGFLALKTLKYFDMIVGRSK